MSQHSVNVVPVVLEKHPNADKLSIVRVGGYTVVVNTQDWVDHSLGVYIEPDYVVPTWYPEFSFLAVPGRNLHRVKCKRLRKIMSMGLLVHAPSDAVLGEDLMTYLGVTRYEPPEPGSRGPNQARGPSAEAIPSPSGLISYKYDVENAYRYSNLLVPGEEVVATEKVHGANARYVCVDGIMYCGSRTEWKRESEGNMWWRALNQNSWLELFCKSHPGIVVYGEVFGQVQDLKYGRTGIDFLTFDLLRFGTWVDHDEAREMGRYLKWVPVLYRGPCDQLKLFAMADGASVVSLTTQIREGIVVRPVKERVDDHIGRVILKIVSNNYLERAKEPEDGLYSMV